MRRCQPAHPPLLLGEPWLPPRDGGAGGGGGEPWPGGRRPQGGGVGGVVLPGHPHHPRGVQVGGAPLLHPPPPLQAHHRHLQVLHVKFMRLK